jgi:PAS domain S-box-containing protein
MMTAPTPLRPSRIVLLAIAYAAAASLSIVFAIPSGGIPPLWLPAGLGLFLVSRYGRGIWPAIAVGSLAVWLVAAHPHHPAIVIFGLVLADVVEPLLGVAILAQLGFRPTLDRIRDVWAIAGAALVLALLTASLGLLSLYLGREVGDGLPQLFETWWTWFAARLLGTMVIAPLCYVWSRPTPAVAPLGSRPLEAVALGCATLILALLAAWLLPGQLRLAMPALLIVCVAWAAIRGHQRGATLITLVVATLSLLAVRFGPAADLTSADAALGPLIARFAASLALFATAGLVLAATVLEREAAVSQQRVMGEVQVALFDQAPFALIALDSEERVTAWNPAAERIFGWRSDEVLGRPAPTSSGDAAPETREFMRQVRQGKPVLGALVQRQRKDGRTVDLRLSMTPAQDASGQLIRVLAIAEDLTARRETAEALREGEERYRLVFEGVSDAIILSDRMTGRILDANQAAEQRYGYSRAELLTLSTVDLSDDPAGAELELGETRRSGSYQVPLRWHRSRDGRRFPVTVSIQRLNWRGQQAAVSVIRDITEEVNEADQARRREEYLEAMLAQASDFVTILDHTGVIQYQSPSVTRMLGWGQAELVGHPVNEFIHEDDRSQLRDALRRGLAQPGAIVTSVVRVRRPDGSWRVLEGVGRYLPDAPGIRGFLLNSRDITERQEAEALGQRSSERFEIVANATNDVVWEYDIAGPNSWWSEGLTRVFGWRQDELLPMIETWSQRIHPDDRDRVLESFNAAISSSATEWRSEYRFRRASGEYAEVIDQAWSIVRDGDGRVLRIVGGISDVTEQRDAERLLAESREQLRQATKMEAMGRLAGGIAHDFNNILTSLLGHAELALTQLPEGHPLEEDLREIRAAGRRAAGLTRQLLAFSRKQVLEPRVVDLNEIVSGVHKMLARVIGEDVQLVLHLAPDLVKTVADPGQLEQVLVNLAINARDAMPDGGRLTIETANAPAGALPGKPGRAVQLSVADTGQGMDPETQARIFEPFFTTKELGKGTGLGLAMAYGTVQQSGGQIEVDSEVGRGTVFQILLPEVRPTVAATLEGPGGPPPGGGTETILLIEDEAPVRGMLQRQLSQLGYRLHVAASGEDALRCVEAIPDPIDLVIADVVMPGMSGPKVVAELSRERPDIRVLYISGYIGTETVQEEVQNLGRMFLAKPFTPDELARRVREVLDD